MPLPQRAVVKSVQKIANDLGLKVILKRRGKLGKKTVSLPPQILDQKGETVRLGNVFWPDPGEIKAENITLKVVPSENYPDDYVGGPWKLLFFVKISEEKKAVLGAYRQLLLNLENSKFEKNLLDWKKKFRLNQKEWKTIGPQVRKMMENNRSPEEITGFLQKCKAKKQ
jgi:hypothetical protein